MKRIAALAVLTASFALAACGSYDADPPAQAAPQRTAARLPDACSLLDDADVTALLGGAADPESALNVQPEHQTNCDWALRDEETFSVGLIQLSVFDSPRFLPRDGFAADDTADVSVPGAGEAFTVQDGNELDVNMVVDGKRVVLAVTPVRGRSADPDALLAAASGLATRVAAA